MKDSLRLSKFRTQTGISLDPRIIAYVCPTGWLDPVKARQLCSAAGIPTPTDDFDLLGLFQEYTLLFNNYLQYTTGIESKSQSSLPMKKLNVRQ
jgi:hypothetical protein